MTTKKEFYAAYRAIRLYNRHNSYTRKLGKLSLLHKFFNEIDRLTVAIVTKALICYTNRGVTK